MTSNDQRFSNLIWSMSEERFIELLRLKLSDDVCFSGVSFPKKGEWEDFEESEMVNSFHEVLINILQSAPNGNKDTLDLSGAVFPLPLQWEGFEIKKRLILTDAKFHGNFLVKEVKFLGRVGFDEVKFYGDVEFDNVKFPDSNKSYPDEGGGHIITDHKSFREIVSCGEFKFHKTDCGGKIDFSDADFKNKVYFDATKASLFFHDTKFSKNVYFNSCKNNIIFNFYNTEFRYAPPLLRDTEISPSSKSDLTRFLGKTPKCIRFVKRLCVGAETKIKYVKIGIKYVMKFFNDEINIGKCKKEHESARKKNHALFVKSLNYWKEHENSCREYRLFIENRKDYMEAGVFYASELHARSKRPGIGLWGKPKRVLDVKIPLFLYRNISGSGQSMLLPLLWLVGMIFGWGYLFMRVMASCGIGGGWNDGLALSLRSAVSFYARIGGWSESLSTLLIGSHACFWRVQFLILSETLLAIVFVAAFILALRWQLRRH